MGLLSRVMYVAVIGGGLVYGWHLRSAPTTPVPVPAGNSQGLKSTPAKAPAVENVVQANDLTSLENSTRTVLLDAGVQQALKSLKDVMVRVHKVPTAEEDYTRLTAKLEALKKAPTSRDAIYEAAISTRAALLMWTAHPQYTSFAAADRAQVDRAFSAVETYHKERQDLKTRCSRGVTVRGLRCG